MNRRGGLPMLSSLALSAGSIVVAVVVAGALIAAAGASPWHAYAGMFETALGSKFAVGTTIN